MADRKITELTALAAGSQATGDLLTIVDISEGAAADKNKKMTMESLFKGIPGNVGIGVSNPAATLHLSDPNHGIAAGYVGNTLPNSAGIYTSSSTAHGQAYGTLIIQARAEFSGYGICFRSSNAERMRILPSGGITFNGDTAQANALDDYEEGTWSSTVGGITASTNVVSGSYTKVGNAVFIHGIIVIAGKTSGSGNAFFNLPFQPKSTGTEQSGMQITLNTIDTSRYYVAPFNGGAATFFYNSNQTALTGSAMGNGTIGFNGSYITNT